MLPSTVASFPVKSNKLIELKHETVTKIMFLGWDLFG